MFRTEGVKLAGDDDTPLRSRIARPVGLPPISEMGKMGLVHLRALLSEFNSNDGGEGLELDEFVRVMSEVLPGMSQEALEAQFMKVDANSDGSVSWDEFSNFILAAGAAADAAGALRRETPWGCTNCRAARCLSAPVRRSRKCWSGRGRLKVGAPCAATGA